jgi:hypothetical protein
MLSFSLKKKSSIIVRIKNLVSKGILPFNGALPSLLRVCLDGEKISVRIALFGLVIENSVRLVISRKI